MANGAAAFPFDTHDFVKRLTAAGVSTAVAEVFTKEHASLISSMVSKKEMQNVFQEYKSANKTDFKHLEEKIETKLDLLKKDMTIRLGSLVIAGLGAMSLIFALISRFILMSLPGMY